MQEFDSELVLDANAAAGILQEIFGAEMTAAPTQCASCGNQGLVGRCWPSCSPRALCCAVPPVRPSSCE